MIGFDTNVLVRYLIEDDPLQSMQVSQLIENNKSKPILISLLTIQETEWVLRTAYKLNKIAVIHVFKSLLETFDVKIENEEVLEEALLEYENTNADFNDCLMAVQYIHLHCECMYTFDKKAASLKSARLLT